MSLRHGWRALLLASLAGALSACHAAPAADDVRLGQVVITRAQCGSCHVIPGVADARGQVGPPLTGFARRTIIAGMLPNTRDNLVRWLLNPQAIVPGNAMPTSGLSPREAQDAAAYLDTLD